MPNYKFLAIALLATAWLPSIGATAGETHTTATGNSIGLTLDQYSGEASGNFAVEGTNINAEVFQVGNGHWDVSISGADINAQLVSMPCPPGMAPEPIELSGTGDILIIARCI